MNTTYSSFRDFYPSYLSEHQNPICRRLHFVGTALLLAPLLYTLMTRHWWLLLAVPIVGYGFAWVGHFVFERNRPATFSHPLYSLGGDFVMFYDILRGRIRL